MQIIYIFMTVFTLSFMVLKQKNLSFTVVYLLSSMLFYYNAFVGKIYMGKLNEVTAESYAIHWMTYVALCVNMLLVLFALICERETVEYRSKCVTVGEFNAIKVFVFFVFVLSLYMCVEYGVFTRATYNKTALSAMTGSLGTYYKYVAMFSFVYMFTQESYQYSWIWKFMAIFPIFSTFLFGNRSYLVVALVAVIFDKIYQNIKNNYTSVRKFISRNKMVFIGILVLAASVLVLKGVTSAMFSGNWELVVARLTNLDYYTQVLKVSEPNTIMRNLDTIIKNEYQVKQTSYASLWAFFIPFLTEYIEELIGYVSFTKTYQLDLYVTKTNQASTYIGEAFANGGIATVFLITGIQNMLYLLYMKIYKKCKANYMKACMLLIGIDTAFYIQRNSMAYEFSRVRFFIYMTVMIVLIIAVFNRGKIRTNSRNE